MAQAPAAGQPSPPWYVQYFPLFLLGFAFYFAILRPQQKRQKAQDTLLKSLRKNDRVTTTSGILGVVISVNERSVLIRSADTKLEVLKSAITEVTHADNESTPAATPGTAVAQP